MVSQTSTKQRIKQFLADHTTLTLATISADGHPQAAPLFFAETDDLSLIFISEQKVLPVTATLPPPFTPTASTGNLSEDYRLRGTVRR